MDAMYAQYLRESLNQDILKTDRGFATYGFNCIPGLDFPHCYLIDIFTVPEHRTNRVATELADQVAALAKSRDISTLIGSVSIQSNTPDRSLRVLQGYGMKLFAAEGGVIWFRKEI